MYVSNFFSTNVSVIDTSSNTVIDNITVGKGQFGIAFDSLNERMYVTNGLDDTVSVIDTYSNDVIKTIKVGHVPFEIAFALLPA